MSRGNVRAYLEDRLDIININGDDARLAECLVCSRPRTMKVNLEKLRAFCVHRSCNAGLRIRGLIEHIEGCDPDTARDILSDLVQGYQRPTMTLDQISAALENTGGVPGDVTTDEDDDSSSSSSVKAPGFVPCYKNGRWRDLAYLKTRGVSRASVKRWGIGFAIGGKLAGRVVVPVRTNGRSGWVARKMSPELEGPPYLASEDNTSALLFGYDELPDSPGIVCAVEGVFDAIAWWAYGIPTVAYLKDRLSEPQIELLIAKDVKTLILVPDGNDRTAVARALRDAGRLRTRFEDVLVAIQPDGRDPDELTREESFTLLRSAVRGGSNAALAYELTSLVR